jgi:hypothetical protein
MPYGLIQRAAFIAVIFRSIFSNTVAGLISAVLLGYWAPIDRLAPPRQEQPERSAPLNIDPISGKLLDRIEGAAKPVARPERPILSQYGFLLSSGDDAPAAMGPVRPRPASARPARPAAQKPGEVRENVMQPSPAEKLEVADAGQPASAGSESWMDRLAPARLTSRVAPIGELASGVASRAARAGRAVADRLGGLL